MEGREKEEEKKEKKYEFFYQFGRAAFEDELQRFKNIEEKSAKYLSLLSVVVVAYTLLLRFYAGAIYPVANIVQFAACLAVGLTYVSMISAWSLLYRVLSFREMPRVAFNNQFIDKYKPESLPKIHLSIARAYAPSVKNARKVNSDKTKLLNTGYRDIALSMWMLTASAALIIFSTMLTDRSINMNKEGNDKSDANQESTESDEELPPAEVVTLLDHDTSKVRNNQQQIDEKRSDK